MDACFPQIHRSEMNVTFAFRFMLHKEYSDAAIRIAASNAFRILQDGELLFHGPMRSAHGHSLISKIRLHEKKETCIVIEVAYYGINGYAYINEMPFLACEIVADGNTIAVAKDFEAFRLNDRLQKVPRYSFQRAFSESYRMSHDRNDLYRGKPVDYEKVDAVPVSANTLSASSLSLPILKKQTLTQIIESGKLGICHDKHLFRDRCVTAIGDTLLGYRMKELESFPPDDVSALAFIREENAPNTDNYILFDAKMNRTSFIGIKINVNRPSKIYLIFDEILWDEGLSDKSFRSAFLNGAKPLSFYRLECCNIVKYELAPGMYDLLTFEPYTFRYLKLAVQGGASVCKAFHIPYETPDTNKICFHTDDDAINKIFLAGKRTFAQNAIDILTDCPSRERAGWLCDSYFSGQAESLLTGQNKVEKNFLFAYLAAPALPSLPENMLPMCYPADHYDGQFIPNWAMFLILELETYQKRTGDEQLVDRFKEKVSALIAYFSRFENEYGLLENLPGWVFIEWSDCQKFIKDVNVPTNMLYGYALHTAAKLYKVAEWQERANKIRTALQTLAYNGQFFVDNLIRDGHRLICSKNVTETCQYYAFFTHTATQNDYPLLYKTMEENFGPLCENVKYSKIPRSNAFIGNFLRLKWLAEIGSYDKLLEEFIPYFLKMADRTMTLWENNGPQASCCHGFASYINVILARIEFGYFGFDLKNKIVFISKNFQAVNAEARFPIGNSYLSVNIRNGKRTLSLPKGFSMQSPPSV